MGNKLSWNEHTCVPRQSTILCPCWCHSKMCGRRILQLNCQSFAGPVSLGCDLHKSSCKGIAFSHFSWDRKVKGSYGGWRALPQWDKTLVKSFLLKNTSLLYRNFWKVFKMIILGSVRAKRDSFWTLHLKNLVGFLELKPMQ